MPSTLSDDTPSMNRMPMFMSVIAWVGPKGTTTKTVNAANTTMNGDPEDQAVRFGGYDVFFEEKLQRIGDGLEQAMGPDPHGAEAHLHVGQNLPLEPVHRNDRNRQSHEHQQNVDESPEDISRAAGRLVTVEVGLYVIDDGLHQRSTSPRTMSRVPITAITSATIWPRHITSSACRFTNDGGRTRTR